MRRIRGGFAVVLGLLLALTALVAPIAPAQAAATAGTITVKPGQLISAKFSGIKLDKKRTVTLWSSSNGTIWTKGETKKMTAKGAVTFSAIADGKAYKATANAFTYKVKTKKVTDLAATTPAVHAKYTWNEEFSSFDQNKWRQRLDPGFKAKGRECSGPIEKNTVVTGGSAKLKMTTADAATAKKVNADVKVSQAKAAGSKYTAAQKKVTTAQAAVKKAEAMKNKTKVEKKKRTAAIKKAKKSLASAQAAVAKLTPGCVNGVYYNGMITTQGTPDDFSMKSGTVVARVKLSPRQGAHGGIWLKHGEQEIDLIESYGYGRGVTNIVWRTSGSKTVKDPAADKSGYVAVKTVAKKAWWDKWHTVAVTFDSSGVTFYLDGVKTKTLKRMTGDFSLIVSLLSSDWETYRIKKPDSRPGSGVKKSSVSKSKTLPTLQVDWIRVWKTS